MAWIEVKVSYDKTTGKRVRECYLAETRSCTVAEAKVAEELKPFVTGYYRTLSVTANTISEIFRNEYGDKFYKVKYNMATVNEKTGAVKWKPFYTLVEAASFKDAYDNFEAGMAGTVADYEIEQICETKIADVFAALSSPD